MNSSSRSSPLLEAFGVVRPVLLVANSVLAVFDVFSKKMERIERMLVEATPVTTAEAVPLAGDEETETRAEQDPNLHLQVEVP